MNGDTCVLLYWILFLQSWCGEDAILLMVESITWLSAKNKRPENQS